MEKSLYDHIMAQRAEAEAFTAAAPGNFMGMLPHPDEFVYWSSRVPTGTMAEFERVELEESAYYMAADAMSKAYARSLDFSKLTNDELINFCAQMGLLMKADAAQ